MIIILIVLVLLAILIAKSKVQFTVTTGALTFIDGAVKSGKTSFALTLAIRKYRIAVIKYYISKVIAKILKRQTPEKPLLYSNIPLKRKYVPITKEILTRKERIRYKSVVFISEASLVADNLLYKNDEDNYKVMLFAKLFGHYSRGGQLIMESQAIGDIAIALRRCISSKYYIEKSLNLPFVKVLYLRYERYSEDGNTINTYDDDNVFTKVIIFKKIFKIFDSYCYSALTDNCKLNDKLVTADTLKVSCINTLNRKLNKAVEDEKKNNQ